MDFFAASMCASSIFRNAAASGLEAQSGGGSDAPPGDAIALPAQRAAARTVREIFIGPAFLLLQPRRPVEHQRDGGGCVRIDAADQELLPVRAHVISVIGI